MAANNTFGKKVNKFDGYMINDPDKGTDREDNSEKYNFLRKR